MLLLILEREDGKGREISTWDTSIGYLLYTPQWRTKPATWLGINQQPFSAQGDVQPTEPLGPSSAYFLKSSCLMYLLIITLSQCCSAWVPCAFRTFSLGVSQVVLRCHPKDPLPQWLAPIAASWHLLLGADLTSSHCGPFLGTDAMSLK